MAVDVGTKAPDFSLFDTDRKKRSLSEFKGKNVVLAFFPGAFTGGCTKEACSLQTTGEFNNVGAAVVGVSPDSAWAQKGWADANGLKFTLLSDFNREAINKFGTALPNFGGVEGYTSTQRAVFVLDKDQKVAYKWVGAPPTEPPYDEIKAAVRKLK